MTTTTPHRAGDVAPPGPDDTTASTTHTVHWSGTLTALSSVHQGGETRGTITLLRRELVIQPDGRRVYVPIVSGNGLRGRLRRIGEELLRDALAYDGLIPLSAAHALRGGGSLAKTSGTPLSGRHLHHLRLLIPQLAIFGAAGGGRIIDGCLQVGKVVPQVAETAHILPPTATVTRAFARGLPALEATQLETYMRQDDSTRHDFPLPEGRETPHATPDTPLNGATSNIPTLDVTPLALDTTGMPTTAGEVAPGAGERSQLLIYRLETFPAGTRFASWLRLDRARPMEVSFFADVLAHWRTHATLGGRGAAGLGRVDVDLRPTVLTATAAAPTTAAPSTSDLWAELPNWRAHVSAHREDALQALRALT